uniref:Uncharacterized protein n=1 Tax=Salarias fasciatus TaxID=181472 RepID=A0A672F247_SALFA
MSSHLVFCHLITSLALSLSCRIFVVGIGFFSLCFLMTSLGGQFSARRSGDSPFTVRAEGKPADTRRRCLVAHVQHCKCPNNHSIVSVSLR